MGKGRESGTELYLVLTLSKLRKIVGWRVLCAVLSKGRKIRERKQR
jgi:hypothetical protein